MYFFQNFQSNECFFIHKVSHTTSENMRNDIEFSRIPNEIIQRMNEIRNEH